MAIRHLITGSFITLLLLGGCGSVPDTDAGSESSQPSGMSMQVPAGDLLGTPSIEQPSAQAAQIILQAVTQQTGADSRGLTPRSDLTGFNWSEVPCILLEMGFLSNVQENEQLKQQEYRQNIAVGIANGVCQWKQSMESE